MVRKISEKLKEHYRSFDNIKMCEAIKKKSQEVTANYKKYNKAQKAEFEYNGDRTGLRGGLKTTLSCRTEQSLCEYLDSVEELEYMVSRLWH